MHWWYMPLSVTTPAGTHTTSPLVSPWPLRDGRLREFDIEFPPGHNGRTGIKILYQQTQVIPWDSAAWLVGSGRVFTIPWDDDITAAGWKVQTYNVDSTAHTFWLYAKVLPVVTSGQGATAADIITGPATAAGHAKVKKLRRLPGFRE